MTDADTRILRRIEVTTAILLSVAGLMTAWASYQASLWGGVQANHYASANAKTTEASRLSIVNGQLVGVDMALLMAWLNAAADSDDQRMRFFENRFNPELRSVFDPWRKRHPGDLRKATGELDPPGALPRPVHAEGVSAQRLQREAAKEFADGDAANGHGDRFIAATAVLSTVMFLGGISSLLKSNRVRQAMLALAALLGIAASAFIFSLPVATL